MNSCRDNHRRNNGGQDTWNQMHNPRFASNIPRHEFHGYNTRPPNPRQWRPDSSFRGQNPRWMHNPNNQYGSGFNRNNFRSMPFPRPGRFSWNRQNEFENTSKFYPQMQNYHEFNQDIGEQNPTKPLEPPYDQNLYDTIDSVKKKLSARQANMASNESTSTEDPQLNNMDLLKSSEKRRIEHTRMLPKTSAIKKTERRASLSAKLKSSNQSVAPPNILQKKSQMMRRKILQQLFKMNKNDLRKVLSHPDCGNKYDFALKSLIKETRNTLSRQLRAVAEKSLENYDTSADSLQGEKIVQDAFMGHLGTMLDTDASVELSNMDPQVIAELSKVLQEDLMGPVNDDISVRCFNDDIQEPVSEESIQNSANKQRCFDEARKDDDTFLLHINNEIQSSIFKGNNIFTDFHFKTEDEPTKTWKDYLLIQSAESPSGDNTDNFCEESDNNYSNYNAENAPDEFSRDPFVWNDSQKQNYHVNSSENVPYPGNSLDGFSNYSTCPSDNPVCSELSNLKTEIQHQSASNPRDDYSDRPCSSAFSHYDNVGYSNYHSLQTNNQEHLSNQKDMNEKSQDSACFKNDLCNNSKLYDSSNFENHHHLNDARNKNMQLKSGLGYASRSISDNVKSSDERIAGNWHQTFKDLGESSLTLESNNICTNSVNSQNFSTEMDNVSISSLDTLDEPGNGQSLTKKVDEIPLINKSSEINVKESLPDKIPTTCTSNTQKLPENTAKRKRTKSNENVSLSSNLLSNENNQQKIKNINDSQKIVETQNEDTSFLIEVTNTKDVKQSPDVTEITQLSKSSSCQTIQSVLKSKGTQCSNVGKIDASSQVYESLIHSKSKGTQYSSSSIKTCSCQNSASKDYGRSRGPSIKSNIKQLGKGTQTDSGITSHKSDSIQQTVLPIQEVASLNKVSQSSQENEENIATAFSKSPSLLEQMKLIDQKIQTLIQEKFKLYNKLENTNTKYDTKLKKVLGLDTSSNNSKSSTKSQKTSKVNSSKKICVKGESSRVSESNKIHLKSIPKFNKKKIITGVDKSLYKSRGGKKIMSSQSLNNSQKKINELQETKDLNDTNASQTLKSTRRTQENLEKSKTDDPTSSIQIDDGSDKHEIEKNHLSVCDDDYLAAFEDYGDIDNICLETLDFPMSLEGDFVTFDEAFDVKSIDTITSDGDHLLIKSSIKETNFQNNHILDNNTVEIQSTGEESSTPVSIDFEKSNSNSSTSIKSVVQEKTQAAKCIREDDTCNYNTTRPTAMLTNRINTLGQKKKQQKSFTSLLETIDCDLQNINTKERKNSGKRSRTSSESKSYDSKPVAIKSTDSNQITNSKKHKSEPNDSPRLLSKGRSQSIRFDKTRALKQSTPKVTTTMNKGISQICNTPQRYNSKTKPANRLDVVSQEKKSSSNSKSNILQHGEKTKPIRAGINNRLLNKNNKTGVKSYNQSSGHDKKNILKTIDKEVNKNSPLCSLISQLDDSDDGSDLDLSIIEKPSSIESVGDKRNCPSRKRPSTNNTINYIQEDDPQISWDEYNIKECSVVLDRINIPLIDNSRLVEGVSAFHTNLKDVSTIRFKDHDKDFPISIYQVNNAANKSSDELDVSNVIGVIGASDTLDIINNWDSLIFDNISSCDNMEVYANETVIINEDKDCSPINTGKVSPARSDDCIEIKQYIESINLDDFESSDRINFTDHKDSIIAIECVSDKFLAASLDGNVYYYSMNDKSLIRTFNVSELAVTCLCVIKQKSQNVVYTGSLDSYLRCYNIETGDKVISDIYVGSPIQSMHHSLDTIYVGTRTGVISQFNLQTNTLMLNASSEFAENAILALHAIKEGARKVLVVASRSQKVAVRDANTGMLLRVFNGPDSTIYSLLFHSGTVICGTSGNDIQVFDFVTGELITIHKGGNGAVCLKIYKGLLFVGCYDGKIYVFKTRLQENPIACIPGPGKMLLAMAIKDDKIIAGCNDHSLSIWPLPNEVLDYLDSN